MGNTDHRTPRITVFSGTRPRRFYPNCDCGWDVPPRRLKFTALNAAYQHFADTDHRLATPLFVDLAEPDRAPAPLLPRLRRLATSWPAVVLYLFTPAIVAFLTAFPTGAASRSDVVSIAVTWTGQPSCVYVWEPNPTDRRLIQYGATCSAEQTTSARYVARPGDWVGADPEIGDADTIACTIAVNGQIVFSDGAHRGDGHEVSCLRQWV